MYISCLYIYNMAVKVSVLHMLPFTSIHNRTARNSHIIPLRRFVESLFQEDLRDFTIDSCFKVRGMNVLWSWPTVIN